MPGGGVALGVLLLITILPHSIADVDLSADSIQIESTASGDQVTATTGVAVFEQTADYDFSVTLEQWRNGQLISTSTTTFNADIGQSILCDESCKVSLCTATCRVLYGNGTVVFGSCKNHFICPDKPEFQTCQCIHEAPVTQFLVLITGDVLRMTVTPGSTTSDPDMSNNVREVTVP
ncbi:MAG: hypothetical protein Q9Q13_14610 [Acidobacteriota bacterium]|nr:hypothetical protein [Acidobacteriota bacterium]